MLMWPLLIALVIRSLTQRKSHRTRLETPIGVTSTKRTKWLECSDLSLIGDWIRSYRIARLWKRRWRSSKHHWIRRNTANNGRTHRGREYSGSWRDQSIRLPVLIDSINWLKNGKKKKHEGRPFWQGAVGSCLASSCLKNLRREHSVPWNGPEDCSRAVVSIKPEW